MKVRASPWACMHTSPLTKQSNTPVHPHTSVHVSIMPHHYINTRSSTQALPHMPVQVPLVKYSAYQYKDPYKAYMSIIDVRRYTLAQVPMRENSYQTARTIQPHISHFPIVPETCLLRNRRKCLVRLAAQQSMVGVTVEILRDRLP